MITEYWCWSHTVECGRQCKLIVSQNDKEELKPTKCLLGLVKKPIFKKESTTPDLQE